MFSGKVGYQKKSETNFAYSLPNKFSMYILENCPRMMHNKPSGLFYVLWMRSDQRKMKINFCSARLIKIQVVASFDAHYGQPGVYGNFFFLGQIQEVDGTCAKSHQIFY